MAGTQLFTDILKLNENAKVIVGFPSAQVDENITRGRESYTAYICEEFSIGGNVRYQDSSEGTADLINGLISQGGAFLSGVFGANASGVQLKPLYSTIATWKGCDKLRFRLALRFYALKKEDDVRKPVKRFLQCVYPSFNLNSLGIINAPNEYDMKPDKCISIKIGKWFKTPPLFLVIGSSFRFSKETISSGLPLYAEGSADFEAYIMLSSEIINGFLTTGGDPFVTGTELTL